MGCGASLEVVETSKPKPTLQSLRLQLTHKHSETYDNILRAIVPYFKSIHKSEHARKQFYDKMALKLGELYSDTFNKLETISKNEQLTSDEIRVKFSKKILLSVIGTVGELQKLPQWKKERVEVFKGITNCQKKIIDFLQYKYPRNKNNFANVELMQIFQEINNSQHTDYDILINAGIYFDEQLIRTYQKKEVVSKLKKFVNAIVSETNRFYDHYKSEMQKLFDKVEGTFAINRKIPEYVTLYSDDQSQNFEIESPQIFRILIKWIESLEDIFLNTQENLKSIKFLKIVQQSDNEVSYFPLYTGKQQILALIANLLEKGAHKYRQQQEQHQNSLANFNDLIIHIINQNTNMPEVDIKELKVIKYASYNDKFVEFLAIQKLVYLITELTFKRSLIEKKCRKAVDLIRCSAMDLLRSRFMGSKKQIITIFNKMKKMENQNKIKIIRIKNRLQTPLNDVLINFVWTGENQSFLISEIQLVLQEENNLILNEKEKINGEFNHILYECLRSIFGPLVEMSLMLTYRDSLMGFEHKIQMSHNSLEHLRCPENDVLICEYQMGIPYVCSLCNKFFPANQNAFPIHRCTICNYYTCPQCLFEFDREIRDEHYCKQLSNFIKQNLHNIGDSEEQGFLFFDPYFERIQKIKSNDKNYIDKVQEMMIELNKKYAFILKFQNGNKSLKCFSLASGTILPTFYDYLPKKIRKKFKQEKFGPYDAVLFLNDATKVQSRPYSEAFINQCFVFDSNFKIKRKVKEVFYFQWCDNNYLIDVGQQVRQCDLNRTIGEQQNFLMKNEALQFYKKIQQKFEVDYLDLQGIDISQASKQMNQVRYLKLKSNHLRSIDNLLGFTNLEEVSAQRNQILSVNIKVTIPKLRIIDLSENFIEKITGFSNQNLPNIKILNLEANSLQIAPALQLSQLSWLNFSQNKIDSLLLLKQSRLPRLKKLSLNNNQIVNFPTLQFPHLHEIEANSNLIQNINWIHSLDSLEKISLNKNRIKELPIFQLQSLQQISICENILEDVSALAYSVIPKVKQIDLSKNQIEYFPIIKFQQLMVLSLSKNKIKNLSNFSNSELDSLKFLDVSQNQILSIPEIAAQCLETLILSRNEIEDIKSLPLCYFPKIIEIDLKENSIIEIPKLEFQSIQVLNFKENKVKQLEVFFTSNLPKLSILNLSKNQITKFSGASFPSLQFINLQANLIAQMTEILDQHFQKCKQINLSSNCLTVLPKMVKRNLEKLFLKDNKIETFDGFQNSQLDALEILDLKKNKLKKFAQMKLPSVLTLDLSFNELESMQGISSSNLSSVEEINLSYNALNSLEIIKLPRLAYIDLGRNSIDSMDELKEWVTPEIKEINLRYNQIQNICPLQSKGLSELILSQNRIKNIDDFCKYSNLKKLIVLKLNNNKISSLPEINFPSLKKLQLNNNLITSIDKFAYKSSMSKLNILKLSHNQIEKLCYFNQNFKKLKQLWVDDNKIKSFNQFEESELPFLRILDISSNQLGYLAKLNMNHLIVLNASFNCLVQLSEFDKSSLKSLEKLNLNKNLLVKWPEGICLQKLNELLLAQNHIADLTTLKSQNLPSLAELDIRDNKIEDSTSLELTNLARIHVVSNNINLHHAFDILNSKLLQSQSPNKNFGLNLANRNSKGSNHTSKATSGKNIQKKIKINKFDRHKK